MLNKKYGMVGKCPHCEGELVEEGHDFDEVFCEHGSCWRWYSTEKHKRWIKYISTNCGCDEPPSRD